MIFFTLTSLAISRREVPLHVQFHLSSWRCLGLAAALVVPGIPPFRSMIRGFGTDQKV